MKRIIQLIAMLISLGNPTGHWCQSWLDQTSMVLKTLDPAAEIEGLGYQKTFLPSLDFLGASSLFPGLMGVTSL